MTSCLLLQMMWLSKMGSYFKGKISKGSKFFPLRVDPLITKGGNKDNSSYHSPTKGGKKRTAVLFPITVFLRI